MSTSTMVLRGLAERPSVMTTIISGAFGRPWFRIISCAASTPRAVSVPNFGWFKFLARAFNTNFGLNGESLQHARQSNLNKIFLTECTGKF